MHAEDAQISAPRHNQHPDYLPEGVFFRISQSRYCPSASCSTTGTGCIISMRLSLAYGRVSQRVDRPMPYPATASPYSQRAPMASKMAPEIGAASMLTKPARVTVKSARTVPVSAAFVRLLMIPIYEMV